MEVCIDKHKAHIESLKSQAETLKKHHKKQVQYQRDQQIIQEAGCGDGNMKRAVRQLE